MTILIYAYLSVHPLLHVILIALVVAHQVTRYHHLLHFHSLIHHHHHHHIALTMMFLRAVAYSSLGECAVQVEGPQQSLSEEASLKERRAGESVLEGYWL